jgi:3'-phosphoadenosine 5'-phosphosulfate sulfotransferase (PAPS reductase)/FAD synthetase
LFIGSVHKKENNMGRKAKVIQQDEPQVESQTIGWVSGGAASAVACWLEKQKREKLGLPPLRYVRIDPLSEHPDTQRFVEEVAAKMLGAEVELISVHTHGPECFRDCKTHFDVLRKVRYINGPAGAPCTRILKREVRDTFQKKEGLNSHVWGFCAGEEKRMNQMLAQPGFHHFPLIEHGYDKLKCFEVIEEFGILLPEMYRLGFNNNNCQACPQGGAGYFNHIRIHFPEQFQKMVELEADIGASCLREKGEDGKSRSLFLKDLAPERGRHKPMYVADCGSTGEVCEISLARENSLFEDWE